MNFEDNLKKLNIILPEAKAPAGNYVATKIVGKLLYIFQLMKMVSLLKVKLA